MKKTLLVAALAAGFAGAAQAESSVTLYGVVDAGYGVQKSSLSVNGVRQYSNRTIGARGNVQNGSRWGLKGTEDLGNGTSAIFQIESGFSVHTGTAGQGGRAFGRQAYVGLTGESWGTFTMGRQYNAADSFVAGIDPFNTGFAQAGAGTVFGSSVSARYDAAFKYVSPNFDGFQFGAGLVHTDVKQDNLVNNARYKATGVTLGAGYNNAGLEFGVSFDYLRSKDTTTVKATGVKTGEDNSIKAWNVGAAYDFDVVKVHALFGQTKGGLIDAEDFGLAGEAATTRAWNTTGLRNTAWMLGLSAPVSENGKVMFSYQGGVLKNKDAAFQGWKVKSNVFSLGYRQGLSKRTSVYAVASYGQAKAKNSVTNTTGKLKSTDVAVGLTHRF